MLLGAFVNPMVHVFVVQAFIFSYVYQYLGWVCTILYWIKYNDTSSSALEAGAYIQVPLGLLCIGCTSKVPNGMESFLRSGCGCGVDLEGGMWSV